MNNWYTINNVAEIDSPSLLIYKERVAANIQKMIAIAGSPDKLWVHVKTNKMPQVVEMMLEAGIKRFKCATIAEAEMVAIAGGQHILIAHQLVGPKIERLIKLRILYPDAFIASLIDCFEITNDLNDAFGRYNLSANVFLDVNNGMDRSGHPLNKEILRLYDYAANLNHVRCYGLHVYDGHLRSPDFGTRKQQVDDGFVDVAQLIEAIQDKALPHPIVIAGGTPTFTSHALRSKVYCSPGTCVLWDWGYGDKLSEQPFEYAALVLSRVISKPAPHIVTIDLGHKAIAAENAIDCRIKFLNLTDYELIGQSEEHGVLKVKDWEAIKVGDVLYGVPYHICPTVNLYDEAHVVENATIKNLWPVTGRKRKISV